MKKTITKTKVKNKEFDVAETPVEAALTIAEQTPIPVAEPPISDFSRDLDKISAKFEAEAQKNREYREQIKETNRQLFYQLEGKDFVPRDGRGSVPVDSLESYVGYSSLIRQLHDSYSRKIAFYRSPSGGWLSPEEAREKAFHQAENFAEAAELFNEIMSYELHEISFDDLHQLHGVAPRPAEHLWEDIKNEGRNEFESGHLAARTMLPAGYMKKAWDVARYLGVRESFIEEWEPRGGIELSMIDMLVQTFFQNQYWMEQVVLRSQTKPREEHPDYIKWKSWQKEFNPEKSWETGYWFPQYVYEQEAIDYAAKMADRFNRIYLRTLRQLRDLRRYSPVTINNPSQVNIAADGGQQINVSNADEDDTKKIIS